MTSDLSNLFAIRPGSSATVFPVGWGANRPSRGKVFPAAPSRLISVTSFAVPSSRKSVAAVCGAIPSCAVGVSNFACAHV